MVKKLDKNKKIILTIIAVLILCVGSTLAYIIAHLQDEARGNASVTSDAVDILKFEVDKDINLNPTQFNVVESGDNLQDTAVGSAILRANSTNDNATYNYYVYFQINSNNYIYTTNEQTPEIVLTILDPNDNLVTSIDGLDYVTSGGVSGFDITTKSGLYEVAELYEIVSTSSTDDTIQEWEFTVSFINLDTNQAENGGKTLEAEIILSREEKVTLANYIIDNVYVEDGVNNLYYHDGQGDYINAELEAGDYSYRYSGGDYVVSNEYKDIYEITYIVEVLTELAYYIDGTTYLVDDENFQIDYTTAIVKKYCDINNCNYNDVVDEILNGTNPDLNDAVDLYIYELMADGELQIVWGFTYDNTIYVPYYDYIDASGDNMIVNNNYLEDIYKQLEKDGYLITTSNYICFGSNAKPCPSDNLYRIIGVFGSEVKLIKNTSIGDYAWDSGNINSWDSSTKPDIRSTLNTTFLNTLSPEWQDKITTHAFKVGGMSGSNGINTLKTAYNYEVGNNSSSTTDSMKIGLMYVSDFGFAASSDYWTTELNNYESAKSSNWLWLTGILEWTISHFSDYPYSAFGVNSDGYVYGYNVNRSFAVRPVFYLNSNVVYVSGTGTQSDPFRIQ